MQHNVPIGLHAIVWHSSVLHCLQVVVFEVPSQALPPHGLLVQHAEGRG